MPSTKSAQKLHSNKARRMRADNLVRNFFELGKSFMGSTTINDPAKELLRLCRAGKLYDLEKWIAQGNSLEVPGKKTLLQIALETGFHSLIELIARHEESQSSKNAALADAVSLRRLDFAQLLIEQGADIAAVPLAHALLSWEPRIIRFFLDHGADAVTESPFAAAFGAKVRTALRPFIEYKQAHSELAASLQEQADCALRHFCRKGDLKWISLLTWAGADCRSIGPILDDEYTKDPESYTSALSEACYSGSIDAVKKLKPEAARDDLTALLRCAAISGSKEVVAYLLRVGASPNDKENGGSSALDNSLWHLNFGPMTPHGIRQQKSRYQVSKGLDCAAELVARGAVWNPDDQRRLNYFRRTLYECEPAVTIEILKMFVQHNACPVELLKTLLDTPRMKEHLAPQTWHLARIGLKYEGKRPKKPPSSLLAQYDRNGLYEKVWAEPMQSVARQFGVSDVWLAKVCRVLQVPLPGRGYWAKQQAGKPTRKRPPLRTLQA